MPPAASHPFAEELIRHESFVRSTLRGLLTDEEQVQDALQETWVRVLQRPASELEALREPRSWLARVARNLVLSKGRSERSRAWREQAAGAREETGSPAESLARVETRQRVVAAILELDEPYRSVVLLRYEQDLDPREIGRRLGRSQATVRSQLSRAHALLRDKLDREFGDRRNWALLALPLARPGTGWLPAAALAVAVAGGAAALGWFGWAARTSRTNELVPATPAGIATVEPGTASEALVEIAAAVSPEGARQRSVVEPSTALAVGGPRERVLPAAVLMDRGHYKDYERATFSFEHGLRDDPGLAITRNDWDIQYSNDRFDVSMVVDDNSFILNLGRVRPEALARTELAGRPLEESATVTEGHSYFVWIRDRDTDLAGFVHVRAHQPARSCELDWYVTDGSGRAQGSFEDPGGQGALVEALARLRQEAIQTMGTLEVPRVVLQARMGAGGGNTNRLYMNGSVDRIRELRSDPLDLSLPVDASERSRAYFEGGWIPGGRVFRVQRVTYSGSAGGDSNGGGLFSVVVGGQELVKSKTTDEAIQGTWTGAIELAPGDEHETYLAIANSSFGNVELRGVFVDRETAGFGAPNRGFFVTRAPAAEERGPVLEVPRIVLQVRAGAGGGNPNTVDARGRTSIYVDEVSEHPLDFSLAPDSEDNSMVHFEGGALREGTAFVVTRVTWYGTSAGDSNGRGELKLVVAGETLVHARDSRDVHRGSWSGALRILPGEESRTYLEVANTSSGDVLLTGYFEEL